MTQAILRHTVLVTCLSLPIFFVCTIIAPTQGAIINLPSSFYVNLTGVLQRERGFKTYFNIIMEQIFHWLNKHITQKHPLPLHYASNCEHIRYALEQDDIKQIVLQKQKEGWKPPDP